MCNAMMGICIYWLSRHVILQIKNHTQLTRTVGNISQSDLYMLADRGAGRCWFSGIWVPNFQKSVTGNDVASSSRKSVAGLFVGHAAGRFKDCF